MNRFSSIPIARILFLFIAGIILQIFFPVNEILIACAFFCFLLLASVAVFRREIYATYRLRLLAGLVLSPAIICSGMFSVWLHNSSVFPQHFKNTISPESLYLIRLVEPWHEKEKSLKIKGEVEGIVSDGKFIHTNGNILLYFPKDSIAKQLRYGDYVLSAAKPSEIEPPLNPGQFNYKQFLSFHGIYHQAYLPANRWAKTNFSYKYYLFDLSFDLQRALVNRISTVFTSKQELGVASALLVGLGDYLDDEIIQAFSSAGALHVLSVSGMHVGLVYVFLSGMLFFLDKRKWTRHLKNLLLLSFIWFYAMITGFSPAVLRSAVMISMVIVAKWYNRDSNILNTMFASAFILLVSNPYMITEVGFQLSYLAVFGIVYVHPRIAQLWEAPNWFLHQVWIISSVSFAAQLMTFPLGLLYFHQFPVLFLISNLIVIPVSTFVIYSGIIALILSFVAGLANFFWYIAFVLTKVLTATVKIVESLSFAMIDEISISVFETWIIYIAIAASIAFFMYKKKQAVFLFLGCTILLLALQIDEKYKEQKQRQVVFYAVKGSEEAIDFVQGKSTFFFSDDSLYRNNDKMLFFIKHNWYQMGIENKKHIPVSGNAIDGEKNFVSKNNFIKFSDKEIFVADKMLPFKNNAENRIKVNYLFVAKGYYGKITNLLNYFSADTVVLSPDLPEHRENKYIAELNTAKVKYHSLKKFGALQVDLTP